MTKKVRRTKSAQKPLSFHTRATTSLTLHKEQLSFIIVFLLTIIPRLSQLFNKNDYFGYEQGIDMLIAKSIVIDHQFPLLGYEVGGLGGFAKGPGWNYLLTIPFIFSNGDPFGGRILMFILSTASVILAYFLFRKILDLKTASLISLFLIISPSLINQAGIIWPPLAIPVIIIAYLFALYKVFTGEKIYLPLSVALIGAMAHFELATSGILLSQIFVISILLLIKNKINVKDLAVSALLFLVMLSPVILYDLQNNFTNIKGVLDLIYSNGSSMSTQSFFSGRIDNFSWNFRHTFTPNIYISLLLVFSLLLGTFVMTKDKSVTPATRLFIFYLAANPLFSFIFLLLYPGNISEWWFVYQTVFYCVLAGMLSTYFLKKSRTNYITAVIVTFLVIIFLYKTSQSVTSTISTINNKDQIKRAIPINYIYNTTRNEKFNIKIVAPRKNTEEYEYLIWLQEYRTKKHRVTNPDFEYVILELDDLTVGKKENIYNTKNKLVHKVTFENGRYIVMKYGLRL